MVKKKLNFKKIFNISWIVISILLAGLIIKILVAKIQGEVPSLFGYSVLNIITGSMKPEIEANSYILVKKVKPEKIKEEDIISFYSTDPTIYNFPNTHRVIEIKENTFVTKGDANPTNDKYEVDKSRLIGKYVCNLEFLDKLSDALNGSGMIIITVGLFGCSSALVVLSVFIKKDKESNEKETLQE